MKYIFLWTLFICVSIRSSAQSLYPGEPAPPFKVGQWVKGNPVSDFEKDRIYVVEFWATWCGPCIRSIPHLTELAERYKKDVTIIGVSIAEANTANVRPFVNAMGGRMDYNIAIDEQESATAGSGYMSRNWLEASGLNSIPVAYVIGKNGTVEFIGNPEQLDNALKQIVAGNWDAKAYRKKWKSERRKLLIR